MTERSIIFHYHLFKNAGTSLDAALMAAFPGRWVTREFSGGAPLVRRQMEEWIRSEPQAVCFSSHTAVLPPPVMPGLRVLPVVFLRHPIDRIASAYAFEVKQNDDGFGSVLARNTHFAGYVETRLALRSDRQCRNFHAARLCQMFAESEGSELERSLRALETLPFVGLVEAYDFSLRALEALVLEHGLGHRRLGAVHLNRSRESESRLDERLTTIRAQLGDQIFDRLQEANRDDLALYQTLASRFSNASYLSDKAVEGLV